MDQSDLQNCMADYLISCSHHKAEQDIRADAVWILSKMLDCQCSAEQIRQSLLRVWRVILIRECEQEPVKMLENFRRLSENLMGQLNRNELVNRTVEAIVRIETEIEIETEREIEREIEREKILRDAVHGLLLELSNHALKMMSVDFLADFLGIGRSVFFEKIKMATGETPHQMLLNEKLRRSLILLSDDSMNHQLIAEIADTLGFSSAAYFRKVFKNAFSFLPSELPDRTKLPLDEVTQNHN